MDGLTDKRKSSLALTDKQRKLLDFIIETIEERGYCPTYKEMGNHLGGQTNNAVRDKLKALERKHYIQCRGKLSRRAITVLRKPGNGYVIKHRKPALIATKEGKVLKRVMMFHMGFELWPS